MANHRTYLVSTDVRKAFDTVDFDAFTYSLRLMGFDEGTVSFFGWRGFLLLGLEGFCCLGIFDLAMVICADEAFFPYEKTISR